MMSDEKYLEFQNNCRKINKRIDAMWQGSQIPFSIVAEQCHSNNNLYRLIFTFNMPKKKDNDENTTYAIRMVNSLMYNLHFVRSYIYYSPSGMFQIKIRPEWEYYHSISKE